MTYRILSVGSKSKLHCPACGARRIWNVYTGTLLKTETAEHHRFCSGCGWTGHIKEVFVLSSERDAMKQSFIATVTSITTKASVLPNDGGTEADDE